MGRFIGFVLFLCLPAWAELRIWEAVNGSVVEAELVEVRNGQVTLEKVGGKIITLPVSKLCKKDQTYLAEAVPPDLELSIELKEKKAEKINGWRIDEDKDRKDRLISCNYDLVNATCHVRVDKKSRDAHPGKFDIRLVFIGRNVVSNRLRVLDEQWLNLPGMEAGRHSYELASDSAGLNKRGVSPDIIPPHGLHLFESSGCFALVYGKEGKIIVTQESRDGLMEEAEACFGSLTNRNPLGESPVSAGTKIKWEPVVNENEIKDDASGFDCVHYLVGRCRYPELFESDFSFDMHIETLSGLIWPELYDVANEKWVDLTSQWWKKSGRGYSDHFRLIRTGDTLQLINDGDQVVFKGVVDPNAVCQLYLGGWANSVCRIISIDVHE